MTGERGAAGCSRVWITVECCRRPRQSYQPSLYRVRTRSSGTTGSMLQHVDI